MKVKLSILRIPQAVFLSERKQILIGKEIIRVVGIIVTETTLVTRYKILIIRDTAREPVVSASVLEIPSLLVVDEANAESFSRAILFYHGSKPFHAFTRCMDIWQHRVVGAVFSLSVSYVRVMFQCLRTAEDGFRGALSHSCRVETSAAPFMMILIVRQCGIT